MKRIDPRDPSVASGHPGRREPSSPLGRALLLAMGLAFSLGFLATRPVQAREVPPILRSTTPAGHTMVSLLPELLFGDSDLPDWAVNSRLANSLVPRVSYGFDDRVQISAYPLGFAVRLGESNATEFIPAFALNPSLSHSPTLGANLAVNPTLSLDARQWIAPGSSLTLGGIISPRIAWAEGCNPFDDVCDGRLDALRNWYIAGQGGIAQTFGPVTVALGATVQYTFNTAYGNQDTSAFSIGSRVRHGLGYDPMVRIHLSQVTSIDLNLEYTRTLSRGTGIATASAGVNFVW
jgi:hypothetical protein